MNFSNTTSYFKEIVQLLSLNIMMSFFIKNAIMYT